MPNYCSYQMRVKGKKANCLEFHDVMINYDRASHFWRVFDADIEYESGTEDDYYMEIFGCCAWSVYSCMCEGAWTYATENDTPESPATSLKKESERLQLEIEVYSEEPGCEFAEHYYYKNGMEIFNEETKYLEYYWDQDEHPTIEEFNEEYGTNFTEDDVDEEGWIRQGGFEIDFSIQAA